MIYIVSEFTILALCALIIRNKKDFKDAMLCVAVIIVDAIWIYFALTSGVHQIIIPIFLCNCLVITCAFLNLLLDIGFSETKLFKRPALWLYTSNILYFGGIIPLFCFYNYFVNYNQKLGGQAYGAINNVFAMIRYGLLFYSLILIYQCRIKTTATNG